MKQGTSTVATHVIEEGQRVCPFYMVFDVSKSMWDAKMVAAATGSSDLNLVTPYEKLNKVLGGFGYALAEPGVADIAWVSIVSFADEPETVVPLTPAKGLRNIPPLPKGTATNYIKIFDALAATIARDTAALQAARANLRPPAVFFLTDGDPQINGQVIPKDQWLQARNRLAAVANVTICAIGFGNVRREVIRDIGTTLHSRGNMRMSFLADAAQSPVALLDMLASTLITSMTESVQLGEFTFTPPQGLTHVDG